MPSTEELSAELQREKEARIAAEAASRNWQDRARCAEDKLTTIREHARVIVESIE